jgi:hypothetical protein
MKPTAWYDPSNGVVSTDRDSPLFTPLGQVWPLYLERTEQKPVAWEQFYTTPPQRTWVGLTDEEIWTVLQFRGYNTDTIEIAKAIEAKLKEKNT